MARLRWRTFVLGALLSAGVAPVVADDLADLKSRLDAIEQENDQLRSDLADENRQLLLKLAQPRGMLLRRALGDRTGLIELVRQMHDTNHKMAERIALLELKLAE